MVVMAGYYPLDIDHRVWGTPPISRRPCLLPPRPPSASAPTRRHAPQRLPAIGLRVEHLRFSVEHRDHVRITPAHDIELAPHAEPLRRDRSAPWPCWRPP
jgi:hypothetical protein